MEIDANLTQVAVLFGGRSTEHEVSVITGLEIVGALDVRKYQAIPV
jgi:D-alanine-D-alanine ligase